MMYFVIHNSDGDTTVEPVTKDLLLLRLEQDYYGEEVTFLDSVPAEHDTNYWGEGILIIKGDVCVPKPVQKVTKFEV